MKTNRTFSSSIIRSLLALTLGGVTLVTLTRCTTKSLRNTTIQSAKSPSEVSIMTYNVENLFDDQHDKNREDFTFLPLAMKKKPEVQKYCASQKSYYQKECYELDWNDTTVKKKLHNIAEVILSVDDHKGPDILFMEEVENKHILGELNHQYLQVAHYKTQVLIEGPDKRGIDVALLSRLPLDGKPVLHKIPYVGATPEDQKWMNRSRGILEVPLKLPNGSKLIALVAHFPAQMNPRYWRAQSVEFAQKLMAEHPDDMVVFGGDLNISADEDETTGFVSKKLASSGLVTHLVGCSSCDGTVNYRGDWSFFDMLVFSKNFGKKGTAPYTLETQNIDVVRYTPNQVYKGNTPRRFHTDTGEGASDHFPVYARIQLRSAAQAQ